MMNYEIASPVARNDANWDSNDKKCEYNQDI